MVTAIKAGHEIAVIADFFEENKKGSHESQDIAYDLKSNVYVQNAPRRFWPRLLQAIFYLLNPVLFYFYLKYCIIKGRVSLHYLFVIQFYAQFRKHTVFHVHFSNREQPLFDLKKIGFIKSKYIISFHGFDAYKIPYEAETSVHRNDINTLVSVCTVNSQFLKNQLIERGIDGHRIVVIPPGINTHLFSSSEPKQTDETLQLLSVGRLIELKGHHFAIEAIKLLVANGKKVHYTIIGEGPRASALKNQIQAAHLQQEIRVLPFASQEEIKLRYMQSHVMLFPSTEGTNSRREAFGVVSLEAQAMGLPVIGFDSGGFPETMIPDRTGFLVADQNIKAMAIAIERFIDDKTLLSKMSKEAQKHVTVNFSDEKTVKKYLPLYI